mgnify:CR=1 FL=1
MINSIFNFYEADGFKLFVVVGENAQSAPATQIEAKTYKQAHGYSPGVHVVADPSWTQLQQGITHGNSGTIGLPHFILLDSDMTIMGSPVELGAVVQHLTAKTGKQFVPSGTCVGQCGGQATDGCYCDDQCAEYGDCCSDICDACQLNCE